MAVASIFNVAKEKVGEIELNDKIFAVEVKTGILHDVVRMQMANRRSGNASTKTRAEVSGGKKKPWRQKGTGRARAGTSRSPIWRGGGTCFGPKPRNYTYRLPQKVRNLAMRMALSARFSEDNLLVLDNFGLDEIKTKTLANIINKLEIDNALIVTPGRDEIIEKSARNIQGIKVLPSVGLNVYDVLRYRRLILTQPCISVLEERLLS